VERKIIFGQGDEQAEDWDISPESYVTLPTLDLPQHDDVDFDLERDSLLVSLARMQKNLIQLEGLRDLGNGDYTFVLEPSPNRREYLHVNETFIRGAKLAIQSRYEDLLLINGGKEMALETIYEVNAAYGKR
jgi:hypothetical protein